MTRRKIIELAIGKAHVPVRTQSSQLLEQVTVCAVVVTRLGIVELPVVGYGEALGEAVCDAICAYRRILKHERSERAYRARQRMLAVDGLREPWMGADR